jgi:hypothetical protein
MVWMLSACSVLLAVLVHFVDPQLLSLPLSFTRDSEAGVFGYAMFACLFAACVGYAISLWKARALAGPIALGPTVGLPLLACIILTPTAGQLHDLAAGCLLLWITLYYIIRVGSRYRWLPWLIAVVMLCCGIAILQTGVPLGLVQKALIGLQLIAMNLDVLVVKQLKNGDLGDRREGASWFDIDFTPVCDRCRGSGIRPDRYAPIPGRWICCGSCAGTGQRMKPGSSRG